MNSCRFDGELPASTIYTNWPLWVLLNPRACSPDCLETMKVGDVHAAALRLAQAEHRREGSRDAIEMLIDEELAVSSVEGVVQRGSVQPDFDVLDLSQLA